MKRRLAAKNKQLFSARFRRLKSCKKISRNCVAEVTYASISAVKLRGQRCYEKRLARQRRMNARQLKKYRRKQILSGLAGSKYGGICKSDLKQAGFIIHQKSITSKSDFLDKLVGY